MSEINLLPIELSPARGAVKIAKSLNRIIVGAVGVFLIVALFGIIFIVFLSTEVSASIAKQSSLKQSIGALEGTEQKIFLIKDRIGKIKSIYETKNVSDSFQTLDQILSSLPSGVTINSVEIDTAKTSFSVLGKDSLSMATFLNSLVTNGTYTKLTLKGFVFTPDSGYLISLESL